MRNRSRLFINLLLVLLILAMVPPAFASPAAQPDKGDGVFLLKIPRITVRVSEDGEPHFAGVAINDVLDRFGLTVGRFDPQVVAFLSDHNIQHIETVTDENGIFLFVNAQPLPHLAWDKESLQSAGDLLELLNVRYAGTWKKLLPWARYVGLDFVVTFPVAAGHDKIALRDEKASLSGVTSAMSEGKKGMKLYLDLTYGPSGEPELLGMPLSQIEAATNADLSFLRLPPETIQILREHGVKEVDLHIRNGSLSLGLNREPLPKIQWNEASLSNAVWLYQLWTGTEVEAPLVEELTKPLAWGDISLRMHFPEK